MERGIFSDIGIYFSNGISQEGTFFIGAQALDRGDWGPQKMRSGICREDRA